MEPLFRDVKELSFGKIAMFKLPADPAQWVTEILKHFHEEHPWAGKYLTSVEIKDKNPEEGYGIGWVKINATSGEGSLSAKVPVLIEDNELFPLDLIINNKGKYYPLTPKRLDEALFKTDIFERTVDSDEVGLKQQEQASPFDYQDKYPPERGGYLGGGSFKIGSLLEAIKDTIYEDDLRKFAELLSGDDKLTKHAFANKHYVKCMKVLHEAEKSTKTAAFDPHDEIEGSVMQVVRLPRAQYLLKTANPNAYLPKKETLSRPMALMKLGESIVKLVDTRGSLTVTTNTSRVKAAAEEGYESAGETAKYQVLSLTGSPMGGIVFSGLYNFKGDEIPLKLFCTDQGYALQDEIVGKKTDGLTEERIPSGPPKGFGVFFWTREGSIKATEPVFVSGTEATTGGPNYVVHTMMGDEKKVVPSAVKDPVGDDWSLMVPAGAKFHPIADDKPIPVLSSTDAVEKTSSYKAFDKKFTITAIDNQKFTFTGRCGLEKLSRDQTHHINFDDAVFLATTMGLSPEFAETKLGQAMQHGNTTVTGVYPLRTIQEYEKEAQAKLAYTYGPVMAYMNSLRQNLVKEAVVFEDDATIDKVLALNFINPDNIKTFVEYLPALEETQQKLSELLFATRMGLEELDDSAILNSIMGLEKTIDGLKTLLHTLPTP